MTMLRRREALAAGIGGLVAVGLTPARAADPATLLKAIVTLKGKTYEFREENGVDLGDFVSPVGGFTQRCVRADVAGFPLSVFFRPDRNSTRSEVVFELGRLWGAKPEHLGAYTVTVWQGGQLRASVAVPSHTWYGRWRWQSAPRPVVGNVQDLIASGLLPPYDRTGVASAAAPAAAKPAHPYQMPNGDWIDLDILQQIEDGNYGKANTLFINGLMNGPMNGTSAVAAGAGKVSAAGAVYSVMGLAGITPYMPQTGERDDIGLVTEPQAEYICTASQTALDTLRAEGEAGGSMPWHLRDERTGAPLSFVTYPRACWYPDREEGAPYFKPLSSQVTLDSAHMPALVYVPYLLTGDPYHLEDLQFQANWNWGWFSPQYRPAIAQARQFAWDLRTLAQVTKMTPATVPSWLLPKAQWAARLEVWRQYFEAEYVNNPRLDRALFRACTPIDSSPDQGPTAPEGTWASMWEDEFVAAVMGWIVTMGFTEWRTAFDWKIGSTVARTGGTSGWSRGYATPYRAILRPTAKSPFAASWSAAWQLTKSVTRVSANDSDTWVENDMTYLTYSRGALVFAVARGTPGAATGLAWATKQLTGRKWPTEYKWRIGTGL
jgi:hypothetical protein